MADEQKAPPPPLAKILQSKIPARYKRLFAVLFSFNKLNGTKIFPSNRAIAERLGVTPQVVRKALSVAKSNGWITLVHIGGGRNKEGSFYTGNTNEWEVTDENVRRIQMWLPGDDERRSGKTISVPIDAAGALDLSRMTDQALRKLLTAVSVLSGTRVPGCNVTVIADELVPGYAQRSTRVPHDGGTRVPPNTPGTRVPPNQKGSSELEVNDASKAFASGTTPVHAVENSAAGSPDDQAEEFRAEMAKLLNERIRSRILAGEDGGVRDQLSARLHLLQFITENGGFIPKFGVTATWVTWVADEAWATLSLELISPERLGGER